MDAFYIAQLYLETAMAGKFFIFVPAAGFENVMHCSVSDRNEGKMSHYSSCSWKGNATHSQFAVVLKTCLGCKNA